MPTLNERIAGERKRLKKVRQSLTVATQQTARGDSSWAPFYIAIGDYFEASMHRLHEQDVRMGKLLHEKADMTEPSNKRAMSELDERLAGNQKHLKRMLTARDGLKSSAENALEEFEEAGRNYAKYIVENMGHHPGSTDMAAKHFSTADWEHMAFASDEAQAKEKKLFEKVFAVVPEALELADD